MICNMENYGCVRRTTCCRFLGGTICFLAMIFTLALGLILGAVYYETFLPVLAAVIAFAAAVLVGIIALLIYCLVRGR